MATINLVRCTETIMNELAEKAFTQRDVALTYAMSIVSERDGADRPDWRAINQAIIARWSRSGLERVKRMAWALNDGKRA